MSAAEKKMVIIINFYEADALTILGPGKVSKNFSNGFTSELTNVKKLLMKFHCKF